MHAEREFRSNYSFDIYKDIKSNTLVYESERISVYKIPSIVEISYGFYFKKTGEYARVGTFYAEDKAYRSIRRSDSKFERSDSLEIIEPQLRYICGAGL